VKVDETWADKSAGTVNDPVAFFSDQSAGGQNLGDLSAPDYNRSVMQNFFAGDNVPVI